MSRSLKELSEKALAVKKEYAKTEPRKWEIDQAFMGMVKDVGELSELLMVNGGYRASKSENTRGQLEHELSDVLYCLFILANRLEINLEESFIKTMNSLEEKLSKQKTDAE